MLATSQFCGAQGAHGPKVPITSNALGKPNKEDLVIFNLYGNFCTSLVWRGWNLMLCIFTCSALFLKEKKREMKPTQYSHGGGKTWSLCPDKKEDPNSLLWKLERGPMGSEEKTGKHKRVP